MSQTPRSDSADVDATIFKAARLRAHLTVRDVADQTKLAPWAIQAIEAGQFERLPSGLYARAYLRAYAQAVGLDPEAMLLEFKGALTPADLKPAEGDPVHEDPTKQAWRHRTAAVTDAAVVIAIAAAQLFGSAAAADLPAEWVLKTAPLVLPTFIVATTFLYVGIFGATGLGTAGTRLFRVKFLPTPGPTLDGSELAGRALRYLREELEALGLTSRHRRS